MRGLRLVAVYLRVAMLNEMQYRANFFFHLLQAALALGTGLVVLALVFSKVDELRGWSQPELLVVLGVFTLLGGWIRMVLKPNLVQFMHDVVEGTFDHVLTKPVDAQLLVSVRTVHVWQGVDVLLGTGVLVFAIVQLDHRPGPLHLLGFAAGLVLGAAILFCLLMLLASAAYWFTRVDPIIELFDGIYHAGRWPLGIYPDWLRIGLTVVVPIGVAVTVPAEAATSRLAPGGLLGAVMLTAALFAITRWVWKRGLRRYSSASS